MPQDLILEMKGIYKSFPGVKVFDGFDFDLRKGEIHCICGENGAGKSTLIKILSGAYMQIAVRLYYGKKTDIINPRVAMQQAYRPSTRSIPFFHCSVFMKTCIREMNWRKV